MSTVSDLEAQLAGTDRVVAAATEAAKEARGVRDVALAAKAAAAQAVLDLEAATDATASDATVLAVAAAEVRARKAAKVLEVAQRGVADAEAALDVAVRGRAADAEKLRRARLAEIANADALHDAIAPHAGAWCDAFRALVVASKAIGAVVETAAKAAKALGQREPDPLHHVASIAAQLAAAGEVHVRDQDLSTFRSGALAEVSRAGFQNPGPAVQWLSSLAGRGPCDPESVAFLGELSRSWHLQDAYVLRAERHAAAQAERERLNPPPVNNAHLLGRGPQYVSQLGARLRDEQDARESSIFTSPLPRSEPAQRQAATRSGSESGPAVSWGPIDDAFQFPRRG